MYANIFIYATYYAVTHFGGSKFVSSLIRQLSLILFFVVCVACNEMLIIRIVIVVECIEMIIYEDV